jgi:hypothetical protein
MNPENMSSDRPEAGTPPVLNSCAGRQGERAHRATCILYPPAVPHPVHKFGQPFPHSSLLAPTPSLHPQYSPTTRSRYPTGLVYTLGHERIHERRLFPERGQPCPPTATSRFPSPRHKFCLPCHNSPEFATTPSLFAHNSLTVPSRFGSYSRHEYDNETNSRWKPTLIVRLPPAKLKQRHGK